MLEAHYTTQDLNAAREQCKGGSGADPNQVSASKPEPEQGVDKPAASLAAPRQQLRAVAPVIRFRFGFYGSSSLTIDSSPQGRHRG